jgi:hypothetical protein
MSEDKLKKLSIQISKTCWTNLQILRLQKDIKLDQLVRDILEKHTQKNKRSEVATEEESK